MAEASANVMDRIYVDGTWIGSRAKETVSVLNPVDETAAGRLTIGAPADVDEAVKAARRALAGYEASERQTRVDLLSRFRAAFVARWDEIKETLASEIGLPRKVAEFQMGGSLAHIDKSIEILKAYPFTALRNKTTIIREPIGVCGIITPWNGPINQIVMAVIPALAVGCTVVLKPSEVTSRSGLLFAELMETAEVPRGVFNLVLGLGGTVGEALASHPDVDMVSFTGSIPSGVQVARSASGTVKRVTQELGGKSAYIVTPDANFAEAVSHCIQTAFRNSGQSCNAPTRLLIPVEKRDLVFSLAMETVGKLKVGDPQLPETDIGPVVNERQYERVQRYIGLGNDEGATLVCGGLGRPEGVNRGFFVKPTVFGDVTTDMTIAREEIFGPVLAIQSYRSEDEAVEIANGTVYGLAGYVQAADPEAGYRIARRLKAGMIQINASPFDLEAPFGGYKQSGNGRSWGVHAFEKFLETKAVIGFSDPGA